MKICIVSLNLAAYYDPSPRARYGGAEVQAAFVAAALRAAGHDVTLLVADLPDGLMLPYPAVSAFQSDAGTPGLRFLHPRLSGTMRALAAVDADVYYQRNAGMITGLTAHFCGRHGRTFVYGAGSDSDFGLRDVLIDGWRDRTLFHYGLRRADGVVVQNDAQRAQSESVVHCPVRVIPNGVLPAADATPHNDGPIVWAGGVRRVKRPDRLVELARRMPERRFVLVGGGLESEGTYAAEIAASAAGVANLELTGWVPNSEVLRHIRTASLVVNTSEVEGFPNVYLEAWNLGVPVIAFNDVDGLLAREGLGVMCTDVAHMVSAIRSLLSDPEGLAAMRTRARALVDARFSPRVLGPVYADFFDELRATRTR